MEEKKVKRAWKRKGLGKGKNDFAIKHFSLFNKARKKKQTISRLAGTTDDVIRANSSPVSRDTWLAFFSYFNKQFFTN